MLDWVAVEQNTDEWLELRAGRVTGSGFGKVMANFGKAFGDPAKKYATDIAIERLTGKPVKSGISNAHTNRGHIEEPLTLALYEGQMFTATSNGGFYKGELVGVSPDFRTCDGGIGEIKSVIPSVHHQNIMRQSYDPAYKWQYFGNLHFSGADYLDFVSGCHTFPEGKQLYTFRIWRDQIDKEAQMLAERLEEFEELIQQRIDEICNTNYMLLDRENTTKNEGQAKL